MSAHSSPMNCVMLAGQISKTAVLRKTSAGAAYVKFGLGFVERKRDAGSGRISETTCFIDCYVYGDDRARAILGELYKGRRVAVQGRLSWDKLNDGHKNQTKHLVKVDRMDFDSFGDGGDSHVD